MLSILLNLGLLVGLACLAGWHSIKARQMAKIYADYPDIPPQVAKREAYNSWIWLLLAGILLFNAASTYFLIETMIR